MVEVPSDEDVPRLAEIARMLGDFRAEFRAAVGEMVRKDVHAAQMASLQLQIDALGRENQALGRELERERADRKSVRNLGLAAIFAAAGSFLTAVFTAVVLR